jgi:hypothetical protein
MNKTLKKGLVFLVVLVLVIVIIGVAELLFVKDANNGELDTPSPAVSPSEEPPGNVVCQVALEEAALTYSLTVDNRTFSHETTEDGLLFTLKGNSDVFIKVVFIKTAKKAADLAPGFLDSYIAYTDLETVGKEYIAGTKILGEAVKATDGKKTVEASLVDTSAGVLAFVTQFAPEDDKAALDAILSTLVMTPLETKS